jgi:hypothetical protein
VDESVLDSCLPSEENLARDLVRALRVNFSQLGNYQAVNKAAAIEVRLTGTHLFNAAYSKQGYYRKKYMGWARVAMYARHASWKATDLLWGNGESAGRIVSWGFATIGVLSISLLWSYREQSLATIIGSAISSFWGTKPELVVSPCFSVAATVVRFFLFALFMAVLVKRLSRR